jgi:hypothetical protein
MRIRTFLIMPLVGLFSSMLSGQVKPGRLQSDIIGSAGISFETWKAADNKVTEMSIPIMLRLPVNPKLSLYAMTSQVSSNLTAGEKFNLNGLADLKWGGHYLALNDELLITFGMNVPTGKHALENEEYSVASVLSMPAFNFRTPSLGQGLDIQLGLNTARDFGGAVMGFGASYIMKGGFKPFKASDEAYHPGDELTLTVGMDKSVGMDSQLKADVLYTMYFDDSWGDKRVFKSGNRILAQLMYEFKMGSTDMGLFVRERIKGKNKTGAEKTYATERLNSNGNQLEIQGWGWIPSSGTTKWKLLLDFKLYSDSEYKTGGATLIGAGLGGRFGLSPGLAFDGDIRYYTGKIKTSVEKVNAAGLKVYGGFEITL